MPFIKTTVLGQDFDISYLKSNGLKEILLYLHAGACSKSDFYGAVESNLASYTIVAIDFPGCGESPYTDTCPIGVDDLVDITNQVISELNLRNITIIGHSIGGLVGLLYIKKYGSVNRFINVEGNLAPENCLFSKQVASATFDKFNNELFPNLINDMKQSNNKGFRQWSQMLSDSSAQAFYDCCPSLVEYSCNGSLVDDYLDLKIPKLYIYGSETKEDLSFLPTLEQENSYTVEIPDSNHFPLYDNPEKMLIEIKKFISKH